MTCWRCDGKGSYSIAIIVGNGEWSSVQKKCPDCAGTGNDTSVLQDTANDTLAAESITEEEAR